jgi:hypothetical protein
MGCGIKGDPLSPKSPVTPSFIDNYPNIKLDKKIDEFKKIRR